ncbi:MAG: TonB family protein [Gemmatimonadetes bacterium]|nr:TonB family protein [Gemmatimonadota bacterium]
MNDRSDSEGMEVPREMAELREELESIRYEERPSFGPELEAELVREWAQLGHGRRWDFKPLLLAASIAALLLVAVGVPSARAALVRLVDVVQTRVIQAAKPRPESRTVNRPLTEQAAPPVAEPRMTTPERHTPAPPEPKARPYDGPAATLPKLIDRPGVEALIRRHYPIDLQRAGIGGVVGLQLWVDSTGTVNVVDLAKGSGHGRLDKAALQVAPTLRFAPARRLGQAVGTWVRFDVRFRVPSDDSLSASDGGATEGGGNPSAALPEEVPEWRGSGSLPMPVDQEAGELLRKAIGDDALLRRLGPIDAILDGEPPAGVQPTAWRTRVGDALEHAIIHDPDNPAPFLALARLRRRQGLQTEARTLFERGLERARRAPAGSSPAILSELEYERGTLVKEKWLASRYLGRLQADALSSGSCPQARSSGDATSGYVPVEQLIAWNYTCPAQLGHAMETAFERTGNQDVDADYVMMVGSFRSAVDAYPAHVGANVELLLELADEWRWNDVLGGARRFVAASGGHPYGLLLEGIALQRLGRSEEAENRFRVAFQDLPTDEVAELQDPSALMTPDQADQYRSLGGSERAAWLHAFWTQLDPILTTKVNEREVEHYARTAYAHLRFGSAASDPGRVWVRYGRPNEVWEVADASGVRTTFWDYGSSAPALTFRRMASSESMNLTSEGKAYLGELSGVFPQRYGADARTVSPLAGQVSRFRGTVPSRSVVWVNSQVPAGFATGERDTLDVGVFLLGAHGEKLSSSVRRVPAVPAPLSEVLSAGPDVKTVDIEFFHGRLGQAASLRQPAHGHEGDPGITYSDVMVVHVANPGTQDVRPDASWVVPYSLGEPVAADSVGLLFELYGLESAVTEYRLHAELQDRSTGAVRHLPIRPAGFDGFSTVWDRRPAKEGPTREYVTADLSGVPTGRYVLKVIAELPEAGRSLVMTRDLDRR